MKPWYLALLFLTPLCSVCAEEVYTWTDAEGVVHYSSTPPPGQNVEPGRLRYHRGDPAAAAAAQKRWDDAEKQQQERDEAAAASGARQASSGAERQRACADSREIIRRLETAPAARYKREDGTYMSYSTDEIASRLEEARAREREYCD